MEKKVRTGVIGLGKMGILHSAIINMIPQAKLVSVHDSNQKLSKYIEKSGLDVSFYPNLSQMLDRSELDAVFICTPPFTHLPIARECEAHNLDVFVEKPLAESLSSAKRMVSLIKGKEIIHSAGFTLAHILLFREAKKILEKNILKRIFRFNVSVYLSQVFGKKRGWLYDKIKSGGGVVIDIASHLIFLVLWYFGMPKSIYARILNFFSDVEDCGSIIFEYENGLNGVLDTNWSIPGYRLATIEIALEGENGFMEITNDYIKIYLSNPTSDFEEGWTTVHRIDLGSTSHFDLGSDGFYDEDRHFFECCLKRKMPYVSWEDGLKVQRIIEAIYLSAESKHPVDLNLVR